MQYNTQCNKPRVLLPIPASRALLAAARGVPALARQGLPHDPPASGPACASAISIVQIQIQSQIYLKCELKLKLS